MFGIHDLALFIAASVLLAITPGPDSTLVFAKTLRHGVRGGLVASLGVITGCLVHVTAASIGLSAVLAASAHAFNVVKWLGAAYLAFIGLRTVVAAGRAVSGERAAGAHVAHLVGILDRLPHQCAQSESGGVLPRLPPAVRCHRSSLRAGRICLAWPDLHRRRFYLVGCFDLRCSTLRRCAWRPREANGVA